MRRNGAFIGIQFENYCEGEVRFQDGLPITIKQDREMHGFGTRSIRYIVKKYGGTYSFSLKNTTFTVSLIFPFKEEGDDKAIM